MNLGDPDLEFLDPTPNVHNLFLQFDSQFFWTKLASRAVVVWSKRMYSCAGTCMYEGRGGLCKITLSEPLLKLRPRKDLIETLLHEMIHALLFVTGNDRDRDGHGPNFQSHMNRINAAAGLNISIYHDFHDEVKLYQTHWWRCDGPCQKMRPYFGIVKRSSNRAPGPNDFWWTDHQRRCGGKFLKIKEPEKKSKKAPQKPMGDITKFVNNKTNSGNVSVGVKSNKTNSGNTGIGVKSNNSSTVVVTKKGSTKSVPKALPATPKVIPVPFQGTGHTFTPNKDLDDKVAETVRNVWVNKQSTLFDNKLTTLDDISKKVKDTWSDKDVTKKNKRISTNTNASVNKIPKINDYFKTTSVLKDVYGKDFGIYKKDNEKAIAIENPSAEQVNCPICNTKVKNADINSHIDECLNRDLLTQIHNEEKHETQPPELIKIKIERTTEIVNLVDDLGANASLIKKEIIELNLIDDDEPHDYLQTTTVYTDLPGPSNIKTEKLVCACCGETPKKSMAEHLDECLAFFDNNTTIPEEGTTIIIDDDDNAINETFTLNSTGTKSPCPVCLDMIEQNAMNEHLDNCLNE